jgi:hypothetical protein
MVVEKPAIEKALWVGNQASLKRCHVPYTIKWFARKSMQGRQEVELST